MLTPYARRIAMAGVVSLAVHVALLAAFAVMPGRESAEASLAPPVRVRLEPPAEPPPPEPARRLVEVTEESGPPERPIDRIAEVNARHQDMADDALDSLMPSVDVIDEYERVAALPPAPMEPPTPPEPALDPIEPSDLQEPIEPVEPEAEMIEPEQRTVEESQPSPPEEPQEASESPQETSEAPQEIPERVDIAQAQPEARESPSPRDNPILREPTPPSETTESPSPSRGRMQGAVMNKGFLGFEAMQDDIAPYLRHVQDKVERRWRLTMELEYRGAARARAVVDCAIKPNGELAFVRIHDDGGNRAYAAACANAIRSAAPFGPFPFEVPALYREEEIMIRWTFQFM